MEYKNIRSGGGNQRDDKIKSFPYFEKSGLSNLFVR